MPAHSEDPGDTYACWGYNCVRVLWPVQELIMNTAECTQGLCSFSTVNVQWYKLSSTALAQQKCSSDRFPFGGHPLKTETWASTEILLGRSRKDREVALG